MKSLEAFRTRSNVRIKVLNERGEVIDSRDVHNKATSTFVEGLIRFIRFDRDVSQDTYAPFKLEMGNLGVDVDTTTKRTATYNHDVVVGSRPGFSDVEMKSKSVAPLTGNFEISSGYTSIYTDTNNSLSYVMRWYLSGQSLVGDGNLTYYPWTFRATEQDKNFIAVFTELGLMSKDGHLLSRVVLDGDLESTGSLEPKNLSYLYNPIRATVGVTVVVEWTIGITSIGREDEDPGGPVTIYDFSGEDTSTSTVSIQEDIVK